MVSKFKFMQKAEDKPKVLDLYIYDDIEGGADFNYSEMKFEESKTSAEYFRKQLNQYEDLEEINLYVNTCGGDVFEGMAIRNQLKRSKAKVNAIVDGIAASAGSFVLTGCDNVKMYSNTMQMVHNMWTFACGNSQELRKTADDMDKMMEGNRQAYLEKSKGKLTEEKLEELLNNETWLTAQECLEYGLCDEIIEDEADMTEAFNMIKGLNQSIQGQIKFNQALRSMYKQSMKPVEPKQQEPLEEEEHQEEPQEKENNFTLLQKMFKKEGM